MLSDPGFAVLLPLLITLAIYLLFSRDSREVLKDIFDELTDDKK